MLQRHTTRVNPRGVQNKGSSWEWGGHKRKAKEMNAVKRQNQGPSLECSALEQDHGDEVV